MKKLLYIIVFIIPLIFFGQVPQSMSYQAIATNSNGFEIANSQISVQVSIIEETPSGQVSFLEEHTVSTDAYGMFSINIGQGNSEDDYTAVDWSKSNFLKVELDDEMDGVYTLMGVSPFNSVPYSYMAENIMNPDELKDNLGDHTATQTLDMDSNHVSQVLAPELPLDAANKQYVDDMIGDITTGAGEIVYFQISPESTVENLENCYWNDCAIIRVVPENKIIVFTKGVKSHSGELYPSSSVISVYIQSENLNLVSGHFTNEYSTVQTSREPMHMAFPGDTIFFERNNERYYLGFYYQYTVSETQIDDNTTSYSMVSLDEGGSSSGGTIAEVTIEESGNFRYMLSTVSPIQMEFKSAAEHCRDLTYSGFTDWRLPSIDEFLDAISGGSDSPEIFNFLSQSVWTRSYDSSSGSQYIGYYKIYLNDFSYYESDTYDNDTANSICIRGR